MTKRITGIRRDAIWRADLLAGEGGEAAEWRLSYRGKTYPMSVDGQAGASDAQVRRAVELLLADLDRRTGHAPR